MFDLSLYINVIMDMDFEIQPDQFYISRYRGNKKTSCWVGGMVQEGRRQKFCHYTLICSYCDIRVEHSNEEASWKTSLGLPG